jgi:hypothetical protein
MSTTLTADATVTAVDIASPSIFSRIAARVCARHLDRLVEAGASPESGSALEAHMMRLSSIARLPQFVGTFRGSAERLCW